MARKRKKQQSIEKLKVKEKKARVNGSLGGDIVIFVFLCLLGAFMVFPLYYSVIQSMKPVEELFVFPPKLYVLNPTTNNFSDMFGMGAVKVSEKIDLIVELEPWDSTKIYDRMGVDNEYTTILGIKIPSLTIPIKPGRNLAVILEVAAMNNRQKKMGYNAAAELLQNLGLQMDKKDKVKNWDNF